jgi:putative hemolysin
VVTSTSGGTAATEIVILALILAALVLASLARPIGRALRAAFSAGRATSRERTRSSEAPLSPDELTTLVEEAASTGTLDPRAGEIATRALGFAELTAASVMIPRGRVVGVPLRATTDELRDIVLEKGHSRMPVYDASIDDVVGYVSVKDVIALAWEGRLFVLEDLVRPAYFVPERMRTLDLLQQMRQRRTQLAIVVDEQGGVSGIVTLEDLVEELVGEIVSERDEEVAVSIRPGPDGSVDVAGETPVREVSRALGLELSESRDFSTIGGLCMALAGRMPRRGDRLVASDGTALVVLEATDRRVVSVRVAKRTGPGP